MPMGATMSTDRFNIFSFSGKMKILHLSWIAFFITFVVWFNLAPMLQAMAVSLGLSKSEIKTLFEKFIQVYYSSRQFHVLRLPWQITLSKQRLRVLF